jgi:hypothetical protein
MKLKHPLHMKFESWHAGGRILIFLLVGCVGVPVLVSGCASGGLLMRLGARTAHADGAVMGAAGGAASMAVGVRLAMNINAPDDFWGTAGIRI